MKITGARWNNYNSTYATDFEDGITLILNPKFAVVNMISTGQESYYIEKGKWPKGKNLEKRTGLAIKWIERNKNRYHKDKKKSESS